MGTPWNISGEYDRVVLDIQRGPFVPVIESFGLAR